MNSINRTLIATGNYEEFIHDGPDGKLLPDGEVYHVVGRWFLTEDKGLDTLKGGELQYTVSASVVKLILEGEEYKTAP